jgi:hypothetical protein
LASELAPASAAVVKMLVPSAAVASGTTYRRHPIRALRKQIDNQLGRSLATIDATLELLVAECDLRAHEARSVSAWWSRAYYLLGAPATVLATVAGATALSDAVPPVIVSVLALSSGALAALVTFLNSTRNRDRNLELSAAWSELADCVRVKLLNYAAEHDVTDAASAAGIHNKYSRIIVELHARKARLLRGDIPGREPTKAG